MNDDSMIERLRQALSLRTKGSVKTVIPEREMLVVEQIRNTRWEQMFGFYYLGKPIAYTYISSSELFDYPNYVEVLDPVLGIFDRVIIKKEQWDKWTYQRIVSLEKGRATEETDFNKVLKSLLKEHGYQLTFFPDWDE